MSGRNARATKIKDKRGWFRLKLDALKTDVQPRTDIHTRTV